MYAAKVLGVSTSKVQNAHSRTNEAIAHKSRGNVTVQTGSNIPARCPRHFFLETLSKMTAFATTHACMAMDGVSSHQWQHVHTVGAIVIVASTVAGEVATDRHRKTVTAWQCDHEPCSAS